MFHVQRSPYPGQRRNGRWGLTLGMIFPFQSSRPEEMRIRDNATAFDGAWVLGAIFESVSFQNPEPHNATIE